MPTVRHDADRSCYEILEGEEVAGRLTYDRVADCIGLRSTHVDPAHGGKGLAKQLVVAALDEAKAQGLSVRPHCSYVRKVIADNAGSYLALVPADERTDFGLAAG